jgi:hypothetical protein
VRVVQGGCEDCQRAKANGWQRAVNGVTERVIGGVVVIERETCPECGRIPGSATAPCLSCMPTVLRRDPLGRPTLVVVDEAADVPEGIWETLESLKPTNAAYVFTHAEADALAKRMDQAAQALLCSCGRNPRDWLTVAEAFKRYGYAAGCQACNLTDHPRDAR